MPAYRSRKPPSSKSSNSDDSLLRTLPLSPWAPIRNRSEKSPFLSESVPYHKYGTLPEPRPTNNTGKALKP